ncbi:hypothetical protein QPD51_18445 [Clostridioides difficile]|nr:hypothetical protein [Clostridioides difficile]EGT5182865.1 hypothetical protein [Clostridioides difficile]MBY1348718.1 hypothetical protein [Clostridioides difficile]MDI3129915.1 hypothetical protein [Clostridioides difficile]MDK3143505.1 hypothetical protein [Clostridioides difficile]
MDRYTFDNLPIGEQIKYINNKLLEGDTLTNTCKDIGIGRTTIRNRFKQHGYEFNQAKKLYISIVEVVKLESSIKVVTGDTSDNTALTDVSSIDFNNILSNFNDMNNKLNEVYSWYESQSSNKVVGADKLNIDDFTGDIVVRSYKVYEDIQKEFVAFCEANKKYRVQDIISQALKDFMDKYK